MARLRHYFTGSPHTNTDHKSTKYSSELFTESSIEKVKGTTHTIEETTQDGKKVKIKVFYGEIVNNDGLLPLESEQNREKDLAED